MSVSRFTLAYVMLCLAAIVSATFQFQWLYMITKPLVMLTASVYFHLSTRESGGDLARNFMLAGILASMLGDTLLLFTGSGERYFLMGLVAFLLAHIFYSVSFIKGIFDNRPWNHHWGQLAFSTLVVVFGAEFFIINREHFGLMQLPVMFYCMAITVMGVSAVMRDRSRNPDACNRVIAGAILFIVSDALLATDKFIVPFTGSAIAILGTYFAAQYMIVTGVFSGMGSGTGKADLRT
jgi:uncharacterized membrane protein YhhN